MVVSNSFFTFLKEILLSFLAPALWNNLLREMQVFLSPTLSSFHQYAEMRLLGVFHIGIDNLQDVRAYRQYLG